MRRRNFLQATAAIGLGALAAAPASATAQTSALTAQTAAQTAALTAQISALTEQTAALTAGTQANVTTDGVNVRGGPGSGQPIVGTVNASSIVDLLAPAVNRTWWRIASDTSVGYVSADFLQPTGQPIAGDIFDLDLPIPYARQLSPVWCDPADIEMWLSYRQGRPTDGGTTSLQSAIWDWETAHNAGFSVDQWDCSPYAVASAAAHWMPDTGFDHFTYDDPLSGSRVLATLLANPRLREPSVALIWRGLHYVLVRGVRAIGDPGQDPSGAQLLGFYVADPDRGASFYLGEDRFVPIDRWLNELFSPVSYLTPHTGVPGDTWQNRMVTIQRSPDGSGPSPTGQRNASIGSYA